MAGALSQHSRNERIAAFVFGTAFLVTLFVVAISFPEPNPFQYLVFRVILALAAAGSAAYIPGFIHVEIKPAVRAGGALAVFVVVYFLNPAALVANAGGKQGPQNPPTPHPRIFVDQNSNQGIRQTPI